MNTEARLVLCLLHDDPSVIRELCAKFPGYEYDEQYSDLGRDDRMLTAFEFSDNTVRPTLRAGDLEEIAEHSNVAYVLSPRLRAITALDEAARSLRFVGEAFQSGARAVKCESSGLTHGRDFWSTLAGKADVASLYWAWVRRPLEDGGILYSCGMHLLGYPDIEVVGEAEDASLELIDGLAMYLLIDQPGDKLRTGHTFSLTADSPSFRLTDAACQRYEGDDFFHNPNGYWRLQRV